MKFSVKIHKTLKGFILIGVVDSSLKREVPIHSNTPNAIWYSGEDGYVWGDGEDYIWSEGKVFQTGDIVTLTVNLE